MSQPIRRARFVAAAVLVASINPVSAQEPGTLDPSFNATGYAWADLVWEDHVEDIAVTTTGIIYVAGYTTNSMFTQAYVASFLPDGSLNESFNLTGKKIFHFGTGSFSKAHGLSVQADGRVLIVGEHAADDASGSVRRFGLARLDPDGTFDEQFYQTGRRTYSPVQNQSGHSWGSKLGIGPDGKIYVLGVNGGSTNNQAVIAKFHADGTNDTSFGDDGYVSLWTPVSFTDQIRGSLDLVIQPDGKLVPLFWYNCAEIDCSWSGYRIKRIFPDGSSDPSFGAVDAPYGLSIQGETDEWNMGVGGLIMQSDGKFIMAGRTKGANGRSLGLVARITSDGQLDATFGDGGKVFISGIGSEDIAFSDVQVRSDGRIQCVGTVSNAQLGDYVAVYHLLANGDMDDSFSSLGVSGSSSFQLPPWTATRGSAAVLQQDQKLLVCGSGEGPSDDHDSYVARIILGPDGMGVDGVDPHALSCTVYPNPITVESSIHLDLDVPERVTVQISDLQGRVVSAPIRDLALQAGVHRFPLELPADLASGNYLLTFSSPKGRTSIRITK